MAVGWLALDLTPGLAQSKDAEPATKALNEAVHGALQPETLWLLGEDGCAAFAAVAG